MESSNQIQGGAILELTIAKNNANTSIGILTQKTSVLSQTTDNLSLQTDQLSQKFGTHTHAYASNRYFFAQYQCVNDAIVGAPDVYVPCSHMNSKDESTKQTSPPS